MMTAALKTRDAGIAALTLIAIAVSVSLNVLEHEDVLVNWPLFAAIGLGGLPLVFGLVRRVIAREFGSDLLAGVAIVTATLLGQYLVAAVVILMLSGGQALEEYATRRASSVLDALARRHPSVAHVRTGAVLVDVAVDTIRPGDELVILPHEICPVDGVVSAGASTMDESFLSGEPFLIPKTVGAPVISGAVNADAALTVTAERRAVDSRYARIVQIVRAAEENRPPIRRLADRLGAWYTPVAVFIAAMAWLATGESSRFLAVLVIATPCPLLLAIPVAIIGAISLAARRTIIIQDASVLERIGACRTAIFDKTGTLTLGRPVLTDVMCAPGVDRRDVLSLAASLEQYSRHPLAAAVVQAAGVDGVPLRPVAEVREPPGQGMIGRIGDRRVRLTGRRRLDPNELHAIAPEAAGLECVVLIDDRVAAILRFRDAPRGESISFVGHLIPRHRINRVLIVSGDRESEVRYLADQVGISNVHAAKSPEEKVAIVRGETRRQPTLFVGDGLNDAPAMMHASVAVALGQHHQVTSSAAGAVILDGSLSRVDELLHIARRTWRIALQSAIGGMALSVVGMAAAAAGWLPPIGGAVAQEVIDVAAVLNALRAAWPPRAFTDF